MGKKQAAMLRKNATWNIFNQKYRPEALSDIICPLFL
jgi:hypothetical protein